jgi:hypothetical protein
LSPRILIPQVQLRCERDPQCEADSQGKPRDPRATAGWEHSSCPAGADCPTSGSRRRGADHPKCPFANARPEPLFKWRSKRQATCSSSASKTAVRNEGRQCQQYQIERHVGYSLRGMWKMTAPAM